MGCVVVYTASPEEREQAVIFPLYVVPICNLAEAKMLQLFYFCGIWLCVLHRVSFFPFIPLLFEIVAINLNKL